MKITSIKTKKITSQDKDLFKILNQYLPKIKERSILAITSKIVAITEGRVVRMDEDLKDELIKQESQYYLDREDNPYHVSLTITRNNLVATAGIDESNGAGHFVLWPKDPQKTANQIREYLKKRFSLKNVGVVITDSKTTPFRWGVTAFAISYCGFNPLKDYSNTPDLFGRLFKFEKLNMADSLATAAAVMMGEGAEQTPLALIEDLPFIEFQDRNPTQKELDQLKITLNEDLYAPLLKTAPWKKGKSS